MSDGPGPGENYSPPPQELGVRKEDTLSSELAINIKKALEGEPAITYRRVGTRGDHFLKSPDGTKSLLVSSSFIHWGEWGDDDNSGHINVQVIDRTGEQPAGYELLLFPSHGDELNEGTHINYIPVLPPVASEKINDSHEAASGVSFQYSDWGHVPANAAPVENSKQLEGLVLINDLLKTAMPDDEATKSAREWVDEFQHTTVIDDSAQIHTAADAMSPIIDDSLKSLPMLVHKVSSDQGPTAQ